MEKASGKDGTQLQMRKPIGNFLAVQYRKPDSDSWEEIMPEGDTLSGAHMSCEFKNLVLTRLGTPSN